MSKFTKYKNTDSDKALYYLYDRVDGGFYTDQPDPDIIRGNRGHFVAPIARGEIAAFCLTLNKSPLLNYVGSDFEAMNNAIIRDSGKQVLPVLEIIARTGHYFETDIFDKVEEFAEDDLSENEAKDDINRFIAFSFLRDFVRDERFTDTRRTAAYKALVSFFQTKAIGEEEGTGEKLDSLAAEYRHEEAKQLADEMIEAFIGMQENQRPEQASVGSKGSTVSKKINEIASTLKNNMRYKTDVLWAKNSQGLVVMSSDLELALDFLQRKKIITPKIFDVFRGALVDIVDSYKLSNPERNVSFSPLTDEEWQQIRRHLTRSGDEDQTRRYFEAMLYKAEINCSWEQVPEIYGEYKKIQQCHSSWKSQRIFDNALKELKDGEAVKIRLLELKEFFVGNRQKRNRINVPKIDI